MAARVVQRYVFPDGSKDTRELRSWIEENRPWLFFSDVGGFRWFVDTDAKERARAISSSRAEGAND